MTAIRHIVFDLGNVLVRWDPERPYRRLIPDEAARRHFLAEVCNGAWLAPIDGGMSWAEAEVPLIARFPEHEAMIRAFRANWHDMVPHALEDTVVLLEELLAAGHDVTALTNFPTDTFEEARERFPFFDAFRGVTVSGRVRLTKPDDAIYRRHIADFGLDPAATLFFDDMPPNVEAARRAGWNAERFVDAATMRQDLARHGVAFS